MQSHKILLYSFKEKVSFSLEYFFEKYENFSYQLITEDRILVCEYDRKIIVEIFEVFKFQNEYFSFVNEESLIAFFLLKKEVEREFFLISSGIKGIHCVIFNFVLIEFLLKLIANFILKYIKIILIFVIAILFFQFAFHKNTIAENIDEVKNSFLLQRKLNMGYQNILSLMKQNKEFKINKNMIKNENKYNSVPIKKITKKSVFYHEKKIQKNNYDKIIDIDTERFLKMNKKK